jgi:hypothetical protein
MRKQDYTSLASILNQDVRHSLDCADYHLQKGLSSTAQFDTAHHTEQVRHYEKRHAHTVDLARTIARNIGVDRAEFLKACGIESKF